MPEINYILSRFNCAALLLLSTTPALAGERIVRLGQTITLDGPRVRPLEVLEDSRCPVDARCVWSGRVRLKVLIIGGKRSFIRIIEQGKGEAVFDGTLSLVNVLPLRQIGKDIPKRAYRFSFKFDGGL